MLVSTFSTLRELVFTLPGEARKRAHGQQLDRAIFQTLAYFDIFEYPLTGWDVYKYLWLKDLPQAVGFFELQNALVSSDKIKFQDGFYFLPGRESIIAVRKKRQVIAAKKYRRAKKIIKILSWLPFIEMIAVSNSLAYENARAESDIDLFIVTSPGHIWTARFYAASLLKTLRLRPQAGNRADKFCLNFFVSADSLNLKKFTLTDDVYFKYWLLQLYPVYDRARHYQNLLSANGWLKGSLRWGGCAVPQTAGRRRVANNFIFNFITAVFEWLNRSAVVERRLANLQKKKLPAIIKDKANFGSEVVMNDSTLKFHVNDRRAQYRDLWREKINPGHDSLI